MAESSLTIQPRISRACEQDCDIRMARSFRWTCSSPTKTLPDFDCITLNGVFNYRGPIPEQAMTRATVKR